MFHIYRDWSRSGIKPCSPKKKIWDNPEKKGRERLERGGGNKGGKGAKSANKGDQRGIPLPNPIRLRNHQISALG